MELGYKTSRSLANHPLLPATLKLPKALQLSKDAGPPTGDQVSKDPLGNSSHSPCIICVDPGWMNNLGTLCREILADD